MQQASLVGENALPRATLTSSLARSKGAQRALGAPNNGSAPYPAKRNTRKTTAAAFAASF
eukprot:5684167-Alexandrium_andersonii.AAC.1